MEIWQYNDVSELYHWGIKGMKWGVRRFQNEDGKLTQAGRLRYYRKSKNYDPKYGFSESDAVDYLKKSKGNKKEAEASVKKDAAKLRASNDQNAKIKKGAIAVGATIAVLGGLTLGGAGAATLAIGGAGYHYGVLPAAAAMTAKAVTALGLGSSASSAAVGAAFTHRVNKGHDRVDSIIKQNADLTIEHIRERK